MKSFWQETNDFFSQFMAPVTRKLFYWASGLFLLFYVLSVISRGSSIMGELTSRLFILTPVEAVYQFNLWQFVSYMFAHAGFFHFFFNMLVLFFFGSLVEDRMGARRFFLFVMLAGVAGGVVHSILALATGNGDVGLLGFSGAAYAVLTAAVLYFPTMTIRLYLLFPIPMRVFALFFGIILGLEILSSLAAHGLFGGSISHIAHLTGIVAAVIMVKVPGILNFAEDVRIPLLMRRRPRRVKGGRMSMGHPGRHTDPDDRYNDPHWRLDQ